MSLTRSTRHWALFGSAAIVAIAVAAAIMLWNQARDRRVAREAEAEVVRILRSLPASDPIKVRYGEFVGLEGEGFERSVGSLGLPTLPISIKRRAVFSKAWATLFISVHPGKMVHVDGLTMKPSEADAAGLQSTIRGGEFRFTPWEYGCGLWAHVNHPSCPAK